MARTPKASSKRSDKTAWRIKAGLVLVSLTAALVALVAFILAQEEGSIAYWGEDKPTFENAVGPATSDGKGGLLVGSDLTVGAEPVEGTPVVTVIYDYQCPWCQVFEEANHDDLVEMAQAGDAIVRFQPVAFLDGRKEFSTRAGNAAAWVAEAAPERFLAFHAALYANQPQAGSTGLSDAQIASIASEAGAPQEVIDKFTQTVGEDTDERTFSKWLAASTVSASESPWGLTTPMVLIDGMRFPGEDFPGWESDVLYKSGGLRAAVEEYISQQEVLIAEDLDPEETTLSVEPS